MDHPTATKTVTIVNPEGFHARPADLFVKLAKRFVSTIRLTKDGETVDGKSILNILTLGAEQGSKLLIGATGEDAHDALAALAELVEQGFDVNSTTNPSVPSPSAPTQSGADRSGMGRPIWPEG